MFSPGPLFSGVTISDCQLPWLRTVATVKKGTTSKWDGYSAFSLVFNQEVRVNSEEDLSGQVQFHGFSQFLWVKPGPMAWSGLVSDSGVDGRHIFLKSVSDTNKGEIQLEYFSFSIKTNICLCNNKLIKAKLLKYI